MDVEATLPTPITGVMTEFGCVEVESKASFHGRLWDAEPSPENPAVPVLKPGAQHYDEFAVLILLEEWLATFPSPLVMVSDNPAFDFMWMACYFDTWSHPNPFGHSARRIGDFAAGLERKWTASHQWKRLRRTPHTHNPVDDATGNAEALQDLWRQTGF
jgi:hypothetical protein